MTTPIGHDEARGRLDALAAGWAPDDLGAGFGEPLLVVDLDRGAADGAAPQGQDLVVPAALAAVVVGFSRGRLRGAPLGYDVLLHADRDAPAPWVGDPAVEAAVAALAAAVTTHPVAATTLVQLLRSTEGLGRAEALVAESLAYSMLQSGSEHADWLRTRTVPAPDAAGGEAVAVELVDGGLDIILDRPHRRNAYGVAVRDSLTAALALAAAAPDLGPIRLRGRGPCFSAGGDLAEFGAATDPAGAHVVRLARNAGLWLDRLSSRTTAYVHGPCVGAGVELPAFAGTVVADPATTFALPEVAMGLVPGAGGTASIPRRVGRQRAAWLALTGTSIDAGTALHWGLVDRVVPTGG